MFQEIELHMTPKGKDFKDLHIYPEKSVVKLHSFRIFANLNKKS